VEGKKYRRENIVALFFNPIHVCAEIFSDISLQVFLLTFSSCNQIKKTQISVTFISQNKPMPKTSVEALSYPHGPNQIN